MSKNKIQKAIQTFDILKDECEGPQFDRLSDIHFDLDLIVHLPEKKRDEILNSINKINHLIALSSFTQNDDDKKKLNDDLEEILDTLDNLNELYYGLI